MPIDYDDQTESEHSLAKWPFYASAIFIFGLTVVFAYLSYQHEGTLGHWQLISCIFASAVASILLFFPFFVEKTLLVTLNGKKPQEEEFNRKIFFELKEVREELATLAVKTDKVPSVVDQILSKSKLENEDPEESLSRIIDAVRAIESRLDGRLAQLESLITNPLVEEPDPRILEIQKTLSGNSGILSQFSKKLDQLESSLDQIRSAVKNASASAPSPKAAPKDETEESEEETLPSDVFENEFPEKSVDEKKPTPETTTTSPAETVQTEDESDANELTAEGTDQPDALLETEDDDETEALAETEDILEPALAVEKDSTSKDEEEDSVAEDLPKAEDDNELNLDLPDPEETIRKVDALLAGEKLPRKTPPEKKEESPQEKKGGLTSVTANVMIGIGNKPYLRGEGPGLSWEEGVAMNFVEIGKWSWSPPRKNASLTIQVYRNDEDPDKGGTHEVKPGENFELTPEF